jgi:hypothetical protein
MTDQLVAGALTRDEARALTDEVKEDAHQLWTKLLRLYEGKAHIALGFKSWGAYYETEFGLSGRHGERILQAGRVMEALEPAGFRGDDDPGSPLLNEAAARELAPVLRNGARAVQEAWEETVERHGPKPTATQVREVVTERRNGAQPEPPPQPSWAARMDLLAGELRQIAQHGPALDHCETALSLIPDVTADLERLLPDEAGRG